MRYLISILLAALSGCATSQEPAGPPAYVAEAALPEGWPAPGPYNEVSEKNYPAYRAAFTTGKGQSGAFWRLFSHIKKNDIPMTAPVEMGIDASGATLERSTMAFLYQNQAVGTAGAVNPNLEVRDVPPAKVLSYTWQGPDSEANLTRAKQALDTAMAATKATAKAYRLLGYNGPGTPRAKATWELQAVLE
jgi:hypothetical protein